MIKLLQCIKSARWPEDSPLAIFPGVYGHSIKDTTALQKLSTFSKQQIQQIAKKLGVPTTQQSRFIRAVSIIPNVSVTTENVTALSLTVSLKRLNPIVEREGRIYAPKYPKPQTEGWFVIICDKAKGEIIAVKRVGWSQGPGRSVNAGTRPTAKTIIKLPEPDKNGNGRKVDVLVISDGYIGMEYEVLGVDIPALPKVDDDVDKTKKGQAGSA
jgi:antiviral helicase SLH1